MKEERYWLKCQDCDKAMNADIKSTEAFVSFLKDHAGHQMVMTKAGVPKAEEISIYEEMRAERGKVQEGIKKLARLAERTKDENLIRITKALYQSSGDLYHALDDYHEAIALLIAEGAAEQAEEEERE